MTILQSSQYDKLTAFEVKLPANISRQDISHAAIESGAALANKFTPKKIHALRPLGKLLGGTAKGGIGAKQLQ